MELRNFSLMINQSKVGAFAGFLAQGKIMGTHCKKCGVDYYPPQADCSQCMGDEVEWFEVPNEGKLAAFTQVMVLPEHFALPPISVPFGKAILTPSPVGLIEVKEGFRIMGWIPEISARDLEVGEPMKAVSKTLEDGRITIVLEKAG